MAEEKSQLKKFLNHSILFIFYIIIIYFLNNKQLIDLSFTGLTAFFYITSQIVNNYLIEVVLAFCAFIFIAYCFWRHRYLIPFLLCVFFGIVLLYNSTPSQLVEHTNVNITSPRDNETNVSNSSSIYGTISKSLPEGYYLWIAIIQDDNTQYRWLFGPTIPSGKIWSQNYSLTPPYKNTPYKIVPIIANETNHMDFLEWQDTSKALKKWNSYTKLIPLHPRRPLIHVKVLK